MSPQVKRALVAAVDMSAMFGVFLVVAWLESSAIGLATLVGAVLAGVVTVAVLWLLGAYRAILSHIEPEAMLDVMKATAAAGAAVFSLAYLYGGDFGLLGLIGVVAGGFSILTLLRIVARRAIRNRAHAARRAVAIAIYGAGAAGLQVVSALKRSPGYKPVAFFDDDPRLQGRTLQGLPVLGTQSLERDVARFGVEEILLAIPSVDPRRRRAILDRLIGLPARIRTIPGIDYLVMGRSPIEIDEVGVEDLLGRAPVATGNVDISAAIRNKVVLVTGAGGSIGSELCRQIRSQRPARLILLELSEAALYSIHQALTTRGSDRDATEIVPLLGNVRDLEAMHAIIREHGVHSVFHAAAYKHVPLVEENPFEAIANNVFGTLALVQAALGSSVESFVFISTDKAVRPTNIMGASKRLAELVIQAHALEAGKQPSGARARIKFCMVRFGNVLDSSGSVVPLFRRQVRAGGPVTVTHPDVTRYFMTIPEAVQLVLQAGVLSESGDVCVLDMGEPVKIVDLARKIIRLSGFSVRDEATPTGDIAIEFVGLRPGEKLHEELLIGRDVFPTDHPKIMRAREEVVPWGDLEPELDALRQAIDRRDTRGAIRVVERLVSGYHASEFLARPPQRLVESHS